MSVKTVKINFCGFWGSFDPSNNLFTNILRKHYNVEISNEPDFLIASNRGLHFEYTKYDCVKIMYMGENISPDFTCFDYAIGFDDIEFGDRYFRLPFAFYNDDGVPFEFEQLSYKQAKAILEQKEHFCNFIYGHKSSHGLREKLYTSLNKYRKVQCPGKYDPLLNQIRNGCSWKEKYEYLKLSKFTISGDSIIYPGFVTEKIVQAFQNHSIPIYVGNPQINKDFNEKAFVWCQSEREFEKAIEKVIYLDTHDKEYLDMLMEYPIVSKGHINNMYEKLEAFLVNIFRQNKADAFRRVRYYAANSYEKAAYRQYLHEKRQPQIIKKICNKLKGE